MMCRSSIELRTSLGSALFLVLLKSCPDREDEAVAELRSEENFKPRFFQCLRSTRFSSEARLTEFVRRWTLSVTGLWLLRSGVANGLRPG